MSTTKKRKADVQMSSVDHDHETLGHEDFPNLSYNRAEQSTISVRRKVKGSSSKDGADGINETVGDDAVRENNDDNKNTSCDAVLARQAFYFRKLGELNDDYLENNFRREEYLVREIAKVKDEKEAAGIPPLDGYSIYHPPPSVINIVDTALYFMTRFYVRELNTIAYLYHPPRDGKLLTFGTGDSSQLGHVVAVQGTGGGDNNHQGALMGATRPRLVANLSGLNIIQIACGGMHNAALTEEGEVYTWGTSEDCALGREPDESNEYVPMKVDFHQVMGGSSSSSDGDDGGKKPKRKMVINRVAAGDCQTLVSTLCGKVFMFGSYRDEEGYFWKDIADDRDGVGITGDEDEKVLIEATRGKHKNAVRVAGIEHAEDIKCGNNFNAAILKDGQLVTWGMGKCGEIGRGNNIFDKKGENGRELYYDVVVKHLLTPLPPKWPGGNARPVERVACGGYHLLAVTYANETAGSFGSRLFSCGHNNYGQLGLGDTQSRYTLTQVTSLDTYDVELVAAGTHHSLTVVRNGNLVAFGRGDSGQLGITTGLPSAGYFEASPVYVPLPPRDDGGGNVTTSGDADEDKDDDEDPVVQITCGSNHSFALTESGVLYSWGYGDNGALGHGREKDEFQPRRVDFTRKAKKKTTEDDAVSDSEIGKIYQVAAGGQHSAVVCSVRKGKKRQREG